MCIRDKQGTIVILAKTKWFSPVCEVHVGEALGSLCALEWIHDLNLRLVDSELDAERVVDTFLSPKHNVIGFGIFIPNYKALFRHYYENSSGEFLHGQSNEISHSLS